MDIPSSLLPDSFYLVATLLLVPWVLTALWTAPWFKVRKDSEARHVFFAAIVVLMVMWSLRAGVYDGLSFHLLGVTALTLMFGWQFSLLAGLLVMSGLVLNDVFDVAAIPLNMLIMVCVPILVTQVILKVAQAKLPHNFFIYIFLNAFFAAGLSTISTSLVSSLVHGWGESYAWQALWDNYLSMSILLLFPESLFNGILMTGFVAYKPEWVASFHDKSYLKK